MFKCWAQSFKTSLKSVENGMWYKHTWWNIWIAEYLNWKINTCWKQLLNLRASTKRNGYQKKTTKPRPQNSTASNSYPSNSLVLFLKKNTGFQVPKAQLPPRFPGTAGNAKLAPKPGTAGGSCKCWCLANLVSSHFVSWWSLVTCLQNHGSPKNEDIIPTGILEELRVSINHQGVDPQTSWDPQTFQPFPVAAQGVVKVQALKSTATRRGDGKSQFECEKTGHMNIFVKKNT